MAATLQQQFQAAGFIDDGAVAGSSVLGWPVLGGMACFAALAPTVDSVVVAVGNNAVLQPGTALG